MPSADQGSSVTPKYLRGPFFPTKAALVAKLFELARASNTATQILEVVGSLNSTNTSNWSDGTGINGG